MTRPGLKKRLAQLVHRSQKCPECGAKVHETYCDVCGYDLIQKTRDSLFHRPVV
jgi:ribosomal protein L37E